MNSYSEKNAPELMSQMGVSLWVDLPLWVQLYLEHALFKGR